MTIVYTKSACYGCDATRKYMTRRNIPFETRPVEELPDELRARHLQAPVVVAPDGREWSGFNPDLIKTLAA